MPLTKSTGGGKLEASGKHAVPTVIREDTWLTLGAEFRTLGGLGVVNNCLSGLRMVDDEAGEHYLPLASSQLEVESDVVPY